MGYNTVIENMIDEKMLGIHTAYIGKVLAYSNGKATIQPLTMIKQYGKSAKKQSPIPNVPVVHSARYKLKVNSTEVVTNITTSKSNSYVTSVNSSKTNINDIELTPLSAGDIVICVCCDRDITEAKNGNIATPSIGHHSQSDSVVVGIL